VPQEHICISGKTAIAHLLLDPSKRRCSYLMDAIIMSLLIMKRKVSYPVSREYMDLEGYHRKTFAFAFIGLCLFIFGTAYGMGFGSPVKYVTLSDAYITEGGIRTDPANYCPDTKSEGTYIFHLQGMGNPSAADFDGFKFTPSFSPFARWKFSDIAPGTRVSLTYKGGPHFDSCYWTVIQISVLSDKGNSLADYYDFWGSDWSFGGFMILVGSLLIFIAIGRIVFFYDFDLRRLIGKHRKS
jgi:hypothetical protein